MDGLGPIDIEILINNPALLRSLLQGERDTTQVFNRIQKQAKSNSDQLDAWAKKAATAAASYFSISAAKNFVAELVNVRGEFEQLQIAYETILKSKQKGDALFAETANFAATTPFNFTDVAQGTKQLLAYGFQAKDITSTLTTLGNVASGVSAPLGDIVYLYGTLKTQGRAYAQDIRQFTGRGIPIIAELAKQFKVSEDQINKLVEAGRVGFPEVEKAFNSLTGAGGIFYNLMEKQSHTLTGQLSNLQDKFQMMLNTIGESNEGILVGGIEMASKLIENYQHVIDIVESLIITYGAYRAALLLSTAASAANAVAIGLETVAYRILRDGLDLLNAKQILAVASTAAYTAVIAALVIALKSWHDASALQNSILEESGKITTDANAQVDQQKNKINELTKIINDHNNTQDQRLGALKKLNEISPEYLGNITLETANTKAASKAIKDYLADLDNKLVGEAAYSQKLENLKKINELKVKGTDALSKFEYTGLSLKNSFGGGSWKALVDADQNDKEIVDALIAKYEAANKVIDKNFGEQIKKTLTGDETAKSFASKFQTDLKAALSADGVKKILDDFNMIFKEAGSETDLESLRDGISNKLKALAPNDSQKADLKKRLLEVKKLIATYDPGNDQKLATTAFDAAQRYGDIIQKIYQLNEKYNNNALTDDEQKLAAIRADFAKISADIDKYNANPKNTRKINKGALQANEQSFTDNQAENNETKAIADGLDKQKALYQEYYDYRDKLGEDAANKQYAELLAGGKDFESYLKLIQNTFLSSDLTPQAYEDRKNLFEKYSLEVTKDNASKNLDLLSNTLDYYGQLAVADDKYQRDRAALVKKGDFSAVDELDWLHRTELEQLEDAQADKIAVLQHYNSNVLLLTRQQALAQIQALKDIKGSSNLTPDQTAGIDAAVVKLQKGLNSIGGLGKKYSDDLKTQKAQLLEQLKVLTPYTEKWTQLTKELADINEKLKTQTGLVKTLNDIASYAGDASTAFDTIASSLQDINPGLADTLSTLGQISKTASDVAGLGSAITTGDVPGIIKGIGNVVSGVVGLFTGGKKSRIAAEKELKAYQDSLIIGETTYNQLLRDRARTQADISNATAKELEDRKALLAVQQQQAQLDYDRLMSQIISSGQQITGEHSEKYGGFLGVGRKTKVVQDLSSLGGFNYDQLEELYTENKLTDQTKAWFEQLQKVHDEMGDITTTTQQINDQIDQIFTGTTADNLSKAILDGLKSGKRGISDFADDFGTAVSDALNSTFEDTYLKDKAADFYKQFAQLSESGGGLDSSEITKLKELYGQLVNGASSAYDDIQKIIGDSGALTPNQSSLSKAIEGITADQAGVLEGTTRGIQLGVIQLVQLSQTNSKSIGDMNAQIKQQTLYSMQIAANTKRMADTGDSMDKTLKSIDTKMNNPANALNAIGRNI
ncbi:tape measure protein [Mucilaginibacter sp. RCC_168]|uniref:tape measure protein n=1 Tax=Mucilaginibacter sp. RCC_168 TaxID=3239221 RepID=UPI00352535BA